MAASLLHPLTVIHQHFLNPPLASSLANWLSAHGLLPCPHFFLSLPHFSSIHPPLMRTYTCHGYRSPVPFSLPSYTHTLHTPLHPLTPTNTLLLYTDTGIDTGRPCPFLSPLSSPHSTYTALFSPPSFLHAVHILLFFLPPLFSTQYICLALHLYSAYEC